MRARTTEDKILETIATSLGVDSDELTNSASLVDDLHADSLDVVELVMALEDEFFIAISDEAADRVRTVADVLELVTSLKARPAQ